MTSSKPGCYCIRLALAGVVTFLLAGIIPAHTQEASLHPVYEDVRRPPNIVLILLDWARTDALGIYSDKDVSTPNMDRLAERGVRFDNLHPACPVPTTAQICRPVPGSGY